jgi:hypothetical protein
MSDAPRDDVRRLDALTGTWATTAAHPALPGTVVPGRSAYEWLEGGHFLIGRVHNDHAQFPDSLVVLGPDGDGLSMRYFDSRGLERTYGMSLQDGVWRMWRAGDDFHQRFEGRFGDGGATIAGLWHLSDDGGETWKGDVEITYRREEPPAS